MRGYGDGHGRARGCHPEGSAGGCHCRCWRRPAFHGRERGAVDEERRDCRQAVFALTRFQISVDLRGSRSSLHFRYLHFRPLAQHFRPFVPATRTSGHSCSSTMSGSNAQAAGNTSPAASPRFDRIPNNTAPGQSFLGAKHDEFVQHLYQENARLRSQVNQLQREVCGSVEGRPLKTCR